MTAASPRRYTYTYKVSITGQVFYYEDNRLVDLTQIPKDLVPRINTSDEQKIEKYCRLSGLKSAKERKIYYTECDGQRCYLIAETVRDNEELIVADENQLTDKEKSQAMPVGEEYKTPPEEISPDQLRQAYVDVVRGRTYYYFEGCQYNGIPSFEKVARKKLTIDQIQRAMSLDVLEDKRRQYWKNCAEIQQRQEEQWRKEEMFLREKEEAY